MREKTKLKLILLVVLLAVMVLLPVGNVKASLQANPNTQYTKYDALTSWMVNIRNMEKSGEAMGLSETFNPDYTSTSSNGIDVHMMKSTEYGAIAILSASGYGNSKTLQNSEIKTTTGNKTGVYFSGANWEWVAGGGAGNPVSGMNARYYDKYGGDISTAKAGDALGNYNSANPGCAGWHSASGSNWTGSGYFSRGSGGLFSFGSNVSYGKYSNFGRGVAVCGAGL